jgi:hypothetical protein
VTFLFIAILCVFSIWRHNPTAALNADAPTLDFSAGRAMTTVVSLSQKPHPLGTDAHIEVRDFLVAELSKMGLSPEVQKAVVVRESDGSPFHVGTVQNIAARLKGTENSKAVLLMAHYDTVPTSLGASDDSSSVAAILETLRAIKAGPPLKNDLIILFTDGEEVGLMGARAFVAEHPWAKDVGLALNFEARGNGGPSIMFETSDNNGWLVAGLAGAALHPVTNSLLYEVYNHLPNETDLTVFKQAGYAGMNFAYIGGLPYYHALADNVQQLDQDSLQHQGSTALALTRQFGNLDLNRPQSRNAVYFDLFGSYLIHYSYGLVLPLSVLVGLLFVGMIIWGMRQKQLSVRGIAWGVLALLAAMISAVLIMSLIWFLISLLHSGYGLILQGTTYNSGVYIVSFIALTIALTASIYIWFRRRTSQLNLFAGALVWWLVLTLLTGVFLPGASYLFMLPLFFSLPAIFILSVSERRERISTAQLLGLFICSVPAIILLAPATNLLLVALPAHCYGGLMITVVLLLGLLLPLLDLISAPNKWMLPGLSVLACLILIVVGTATSSFNSQRPKPNNVFYALDGDRNKAVWASTDGRTDEWTKQFFAEGVKVGALHNYLVSDFEGFISSPAPVAGIPLPSIAMLGDHTDGNVRTLRLKVTSPRLAPFLAVMLETEKAKVVEANVNNRQLDLSGTVGQAEKGIAWQVFYYAPPTEGFELTLKVEPAQPLTISVRDQSFTLPPELTKAFKPRPDYMIPTPYPHNPFGDATMTIKTYSF